MKRGKKMLLLTLVLVLCVAGYYGTQLLNQKSASVIEETGTFTLDNHSTDQLTGLNWVNGEESFVFTLADGVWTVAGDPAFPLNQEDVQNMADDLLAISGTRQLDGANDLSIYGLSEPSFTVTASWSDGTSTAYAMGAETPFADGYYVSSGKENIVYTIEEDIADIFDTTMNDLAVRETIPTVSAATRLTVGTTFDMVKEENSRTINVSEIWYDSQTGIALDVDKADELMTAANAIAWAELAEPTATDAALATFGVDEANATAITLYEGESAVLTLLIGNQNDAGDYYARLPGSAMVYTVASDDVTVLLSASATDMASMVIIDLSEEYVQSATFAAGDHIYTWTPSAETEEAGNETAEDEATKEAEEENEDPGAALWASIAALKPVSAIDTANGSTLLNVEVTSTGGQTAGLTFTEYDAENYAVKVLDRYFLVDAAEVDAIIRNLRAIK